MSLNFPISLVGKRGGGGGGYPAYAGSCAVGDPTKSYVWDESCTPILGSPITGDIPDYLSGFGNNKMPRVYVGTGCTSIGTWSFWGVRSAGEPQGITEFYIAEGLTTLGDACLYNCFGPQNPVNGDGVINLPSTLTTISGYQNLGSNQGLTRVNIWSLAPPTFTLDQGVQNIFYLTPITEVHVPAAGSWGATWGSNDEYTVIADL